MNRQVKELLEKWPALKCEDDLRGKLSDGFFHYLRRYTVFPEIHATRAAAVPVPPKNFSPSVLKSKNPGGRVATSTHI